jgi:hypothetical protein
MVDAAIGRAAGIAGGPGTVEMQAGEWTIRTAATGMGDMAHGEAIPITTIIITIHFLSIITILTLARQIITTASPITIFIISKEGHNESVPVPEISLKNSGKGTQTGTGTKKNGIQLLIRREVWSGISFS